MPNDWDAGSGPDQGEDMTSHADTIRAAFPIYPAEPGVAEIQEAEAALVALLAENQRLEHERNFLQRELGFKNTQRQEIQRLRDALDGTREDLAMLDAIVSHRQRCDEPDDPGCERCVVDSALARLREALAGDAE